MINDDAGDFLAPVHVVNELFDLRHGERVVEDCDAPVLDPVRTPFADDCSLLVVKVAGIYADRLISVSLAINRLPISVLPISKLISGTAPCFFECLSELHAENTPCLPMAWLR